MSDETQQTDTPDEWVALGTRLKEIREYLNLSQQHVASATGIPRTAVSDIERGQRKVDSLELRKFSRLYRYPVGYLLGEETDNGTDIGPASALGRAVIGLDDDDRAELMRFAEFLRFNAHTRRAEPTE